MKKLIVVILALLSLINPTKNFVEDIVSGSNKEDLAVNASFDIGSYAGLLIEYQTGKVLFSKN